MGTTDYLESGNMNLMHSGTVIVGPAFNLTVTSDGCCPITVGSLGTVAANSNDTFVVPCPNVALTADDSAGSCSFTNWTVDGGAPTTNKSVIVSGVANSSHTAIARCAAVSLATLEGHVAFQGNPPQGPRWVRGLNVRFFNSTTGNETAWSPKNATTNDTGVFNITGLDPGTYNVSIKNWTCLSEVNTSVTLGAGNTTVVDFGTTREGDANNDDYVVMADLSLLLPAWNKHAGDPEYSVNYDFNRDGYVTMADLSLMLPNWNKHGDLS